jgi:hypothetical protein
MRRFPCRFLAAALCAVGLATVAPSGAMATAVAPLRLLSPAEGAVLEAGSTALLDWAPFADLAGQERWEEWEAFLSLDGGATYPVRVTPHLDRDLRRFTFKVPELPSRDVRLLVRVGDEREEKAFELPWRFAIAAAPGNTGGALELRQRVWQRGEPARPGEPGVLVWVEGSRRGGATREVFAAEPARAVPGLSLAPQISAPQAVTTPTAPSGAPPADPIASPLPSRPVAGALARPFHPTATDILLLIQRQNE